MGCAPSNLCDSCSTDETISTNRSLVRFPSTPASSTSFHQHTLSIVRVHFLYCLSTRAKFPAVSSPIPLTSDPTYLSSLSPSAHVSWTRTTADSNGKILVSYPSLPWDQMRATEGWAGFQHVSVLRGWLTVYPPPTPQTTGSRIEPFLCTSLAQGAYFTVLPPPASPERKTYVPEWHTGNVYAMARAPAQLTKLPVSPERSEDGRGTRYEIVVCGAYEVCPLLATDIFVLPQYFKIRLFGDPHAYDSKHPILNISISVQLEFPSSPLEHSSARLRSRNTVFRQLPTLPLRHSPEHSIAPHIVDGRPFGRAIGISLTCVDFNAWGWWTATNACLVDDLSSSLTMTLVEPIRIAPTQTRTVPLCITLSSTERIPESVTEFTVELTFSLASSSDAGLSSPTNEFTLEVTIPLMHVSSWTLSTFTPILATYFFAKSMPTAFTVLPPKSPFMEPSQGDEWVCKGNEPVLALRT